MAVHLSLHLLLAAVASAHPAVEARLDAGLAREPAGAARAAWASALLVGSPYELGALGEGSGPSPGPRFRLDAFDCVTFVETAVALGSADSVADAARLLDDVRYDGPPDYAHRNHYVEAQWVPANVRKGWIAPATRAIAGADARSERKRLTRATWRAAERAGLVLADLPEEARPLGSFALDVVPLARAAALAPRIPPGTVLLLVREDRPWRPYRVTHMGLVVAGAGGARYLRHASDVPGVLRVRDEPLGAFLARNGRPRRWPVVGVSLFAVRDNAARVRQVGAGAEGAAPARP